MDQTAWKTLPRLGREKRFASTPAWLIEQGRKRPEATAYLVHDGSDWIEASWADYAGMAQRAARALVSLGVNAADSVAILGFNRPEWTIMANGAMMIGARPAGIYWTSAPPESAYILQHSEAPVLLIESLAQLEELDSVRGDCPDLRTIVVMDGEPAREGVLSWASFLALGEEGFQESVDARLNAIEPADIGSLIYTSGTTGPPKAVMLSHGAIAWTADLLTRSFGGDENGRGLSYLPLAHIAEQQASLHCHPIRGNAMYFARSMETLAEDIQQARPTMFFGVPRVWEKMAETLKGRMKQASGLQKTLLDWSVKVNRDWHAARLEGRSPGAGNSLQRGLANALVTRKIKAAMGLDQADTFISGAAPISPEVLRFFTGIDMVILEGYGQSETSAPTTANLPGATKLGTVGKAFDGIETKVSEEGELLVRGPGLFSGYMKNNEATADSFTEDGFLRTGDVVKVDEEGFVTITGRIKDILITSGGKNITPANLETDLMNIDLVEHAVVVGDGRHYLTALMTLSADALSAFAKAHKLADPGPEHPAVIEEVQRGVDAMNQRYARVENIRKFRLLKEPLSVDTGELTPTMKVKRRIVIERNKALIDAMYDEG